jgi:hypothetical protein
MSVDILIREFEHFSLYGYWRIALENYYNYKIGNLLAGRTLLKKERDITVYGIDLCDKLIIF